MLLLTLAGFASLAVRHVIKDVLHSAAVRQGAGPHFPISLFSSLAFMCVEQQDQLLLDQLALLRVGCGACRRHCHTSAASQREHRCLLLRRLLLELLHGQNRQINVKVVISYQQFNSVTQKWCQKGDNLFVNGIYKNKCFVYSNI